VGINTDALALGSSLPANTSFQGRTPASATSQVADGEQADSDQSFQPGNSTGAAGQSCDGDTSSAGNTGSSSGSTGADSTAGSASATKTSGPSAQTRNAQGAQAQRNARATGARSNSTASANGQTSAAAADASEDASTDFGSVMATALGRSAGSAPDQPAQAKAAASNDSTSSANTGQPAGTPPTDAVAWIAQVLMPSGAAQTSVPGTGTAATPGPDALAVQRGMHNALTGQPSSASAAMALSQTSGAAAGATSAPSSDAQTALSATTTGNVNALATVQQLISGLTGTNSADSDTTGAAGTPATPATTTDSGTDAAQAAAALQLSSLSRPEATLGNTTLSIQSAVGSAAFADDVSSRVTSLAQSGITQAQLQLNPIDLGPVQVHITMQSGQASVWFGAAHSDTRAALEQSLPRLREMFAGAGMPLTDSGVFREPPQQQQAQPLPVPSSPRTFAADTAVTASVTQVANIRLALLDTYA
jgi:flagellar hook-length control protein FliK